MSDKKIEIVPEEEMLKGPGIYFMGIIKEIENITNNDEERLALFATFYRGIKKATQLIKETRDRIENYTPWYSYSLGVKESIYVINDWIYETEEMISKNKIKFEEVDQLSYVRIFMDGISKGIGLIQANKMNEEFFTIIENFDKILLEYEGKDPEEIWEKIRNRVGVSLEF
jgi:hypothetical protein